MEYSNKENIWISYPLVIADNSSKLNESALSIDPAICWFRCNCMVSLGPASCIMARCVKSGCECVRTVRSHSNRSYDRRNFPPRVNMFESFPWWSGCGTFNSLACRPVIGAVAGLGCSVTLVSTFLMVAELLTSAFGKVVGKVMWRVLADMAASSWCQFSLAGIDVAVPFITCAPHSSIWVSLPRLLWAEGSTNAFGCVCLVGCGTGDLDDLPLGLRHCCCCWCQRNSRLASSLFSFGWLGNGSKEYPRSSAAPFSWCCPTDICWFLTGCAPTACVWVPDESTAIWWSE